MTASNFSFPKKPFVETILGLLLLLVLLYASFQTISAFIGVFAFSAIFAVSFSGVFEKLANLFGQRRNLTAVILGILLLGTVALAFVLIVHELKYFLHGIQSSLTAMQHKELPAVPENLANLPTVGPWLQEFRHDVQHDPQSTLRTYEPRIRVVAEHLLIAGGGIILSALEMVLGIVIAMALLAKKDKVLPPLEAILNRLAGEVETPVIMNAMGSAIKGVAVGVMGTGLIAAVVTYIGYAITPLSIASGLAALVFFLVVIQVGSMLVWLPVIIWFASQGMTGWAIYSAFFGVVVLTFIDHILKPILIAKSGKLPVLVLFLGVVGGMAAWGFTGMFKGALLMAVGYTLFHTWFLQAEEAPSSEATASSDGQPTGSMEQTS